MAEFRITRTNNIGAQQTFHAKNCTVVTMETPSGQTQILGYFDDPEEVHTFLTMNGEEIEVELVSE